MTNGAIGGEELTLSGLITNKCPLSQEYIESTLAPAGTYLGKELDEDRVILTVNILFPAIKSMISCIDDSDVIDVDTSDKDVYTRVKVLL